jgi:AraC-like DNA-binding protein
MLDQSAAMKPELAEIRDWAALARDNNYQVDALARACGVSRWCLNQFFLTRTELHAHEWLGRLKQMDGVFLLAKGLEIKDVAGILKYSDPAHFWRDFKQVHQMTPGEARRLGLMLNAALARTPLPLFSLAQAISPTAITGR